MVWNLKFILKVNMKYYEVCNGIRKSQTLAVLTRKGNKIFFVKHHLHVSDQYRTINNFSILTAECPLSCDNGGTLIKDQCKCACTTGWRPPDCSGNICLLQQLLRPRQLSDEARFLMHVFGFRYSGLSLGFFFFFFLLDGSQKDARAYGSCECRM